MDDTVFLYVKVKGADDRAALRFSRSRHPFSSGRAKKKFVPICVTASAKIASVRRICPENQAEWRGLEKGSSENDAD
jgi:hypothetical protein